MSAVSTVCVNATHGVSNNQPPGVAELDSSRLRYYARYFGDPRSRLFWQGDDLFMGILFPHAATFERMSQHPAVRTLVADGLLADLEQAFADDSGFEAVYRIGNSPRITYWHEWSPRMWRAAALRMIELMHRLAEQGLTLRNAHPWNLLYTGRDFLYIHPGSIVPLDCDTFSRSYEKLARFLVRPLIVAQEGLTHMARRLAEDPRDGVLDSELKGFPAPWSFWQPDYTEQDIPRFLQGLANRLLSFRCNIEGERWIDYFATDCDFSPGTSWTFKQHALDGMLRDTEIRSVLDLGANTGHYARVAARHGREVIAGDFDPALVDVIFAEARKADLSVYPVVMDFTHPSPGQGVDNNWFPPATNRFKSDLVLCFALSHHLVFGKYRLDFEQIARGISSFSKRWALVEYVERGKIRPAEWRPDADAWYTAENLAIALRRRFPIVEILAPATDGRRLLVCGPERRVS